ncbi:MAG: hypothetical protein WKF79_00675 [Nocardioides sp.]
MTRRWSLGQAVLRGLIALGPLVAVGVTTLVGQPPPGWLLALTAVLAAGYAYLPDSSFGTFALLLVLGWWSIVSQGALHPEVLVAAAAVLASHVAALIAAYGPDDLLVDPRLVRLWVRRGGLVLLAAPMAWLAANALRGQPEPPGVWIAGVVAAVTSMVVASAAFRGSEEADV